MGLLDIDDRISESTLLENGWEDCKKVFGIDDLYIKVEYREKEGDLKLFCFTLTYSSESDKWCIEIVGADRLEVNTYADITTYIHSILK